MFERLPTPWGLVRLGVAPDHPKLKAVSRAFERIAARPGFRFLGNVEVGRDVYARRARASCTTRSSTPSARRPTGASASRARSCRDRGRRPSSSPGTTATPTSRTSPFDLDVERAVVIGNGNVALDVARMLALTAEELAPTDTTDAAIAAIAALGDPRDRRGRPPRARRRPRSRRPSCQELGRARGRRRRRRSGRARARRRRARPRSSRRDARSATWSCCATSPARAPTGKPKTRRSPLPPLAGRDLGEERVEGDRARRATRSSRTSTGASRAVPTDERETLPVRARLPQRRLPRGRARRRAVRRAARHDAQRGRPRARRGRRAGAGRVLRGLDQARPDGVIGTNKKDATETVELLLEDARPGGSPRRDATGRGGRRAARGARRRAVVYAGWEAIDARERTARRAARPAARQALDWDELLDAARAVAASSRVRGQPPPHAATPKGGDGPRAAAPTPFHVDTLTSSA